MTAEDLTVQYVLGELRADEAAEFERRLAADESLATEVRDLQAAMGLLPYAVAAEPPPELRSKIIRAAEEKIGGPIARTTRPPRRIVWSRFAAAIAATLALAVGLDNVRVRQELGLQRDLARLLVEPNVVHTFTVSGAAGAGTVALDMDAQRGAVVLAGVRSLPTGQTYRLWADVDGRSVFCGDFAAPEGGRVLAQFRVPVEQYNGRPRKLFVTIEPTGTPTVPSSTRVMESV